MYDKIDYERARRILATYAPHDSTFVGITLNFSPSMKVQFNRPKIKIDWGSLPPTLQIQWTLDYVNRVYKQHFDDIIMSFEISENNKLHAHILGLINDSFKAYNILQVRGITKLHPYVNKWVGKNNFITSNYIHAVEDVAGWLQYLFKDDHKNPFYIYHLHSRGWKVKQTKGIFCLSEDD